MPYEYACEHGIHGFGPFVHHLGPTTTTGTTLPAPVCHPLIVEVLP